MPTGGKHLVLETKYEIPQSSTFGPTLLLIFINDFAFLENLNLILFADDTTSIDKSPSLELLNRQMVISGARIEQWFSANKLYESGKIPGVKFFSNTDIDK